MYRVFFGLASLLFFFSANANNIESLYIKGLAGDILRPYQYSIISHKPLDSVLFKNNLLIKVTEGKVSDYDLCEWRKIVIHGYGGIDNVRASDICDYSISITEAYPSYKAANASIVKSYCGGTMCTPKIWLLYQMGGDIKYTEIPNFTAQINSKPTIEIFTSSNGDVTGAILKSWQSPTMTNIGDPIYLNYYLIPEIGFLDSKARGKWLGMRKWKYKNPSDFFEDRALRNSILATLDAKDFRLLRETMSGPGSVRTQDGRYIILEGCMAHACIFQNAILIIDSYSDNYFAVATIKDVDSTAHRTWQKEKMSEDMVAAVEKIVFNYDDKLHTNATSGWIKLRGEIK